MTRKAPLRNTFIGLWGMARPLVMVSNILSWLLGVSIAYGSGFGIGAEAVGYSFMVMIVVSASIHYANEYADHETDALTIRTPYSGGSGIISRGLVPRSLALVSAWAAFSLGLLVQLAAVLLGIHPWSASAVLVIGAIGGWMYSLPPLKLGWRGWGEVDNAFLGSNLLPLYGYVTTSGRFDSWVMLACLPFSFIAFTNLLAVTWPDRSADARVGKMTLATLWRPERLRVLNGVMLVASFVLLLALRGWILPAEVVLASFAALPLLLWGATTYTKTRVSTGIVYGMMTMMVSQTIAWFSVGMGLTLT
jgi:1,4-dihydroxy-2-naphthoate octaprenyltransferase